MASKVILVGRRQLFLAGLARILGELGFDVAIVPGPADLSNSGDPPLVVVDKPETVASIADEIAALKGRTPAPRIVVIADAFDESEVSAAFVAGADGYLLANLSPEALCESLKLVMLGESVFPSPLVAALCARSQVARAGQGEAAETALSEREAQIVARLAEGMPNKVIASELTITEATVKVHLKSILRKLGVTNRTQAAVWAINHGLSPRPHPVQ